MFDEAFRTLFMSKPSKLSHKNNNLIIGDKTEVFIPLRDIHTIIIDTPQIILTSSLMKECAKHKILVFFCDDSHLPSGVFAPFLTHYRNAQVLQCQISLSKQRKAILWQNLIKVKIQNQANLLSQENKTSTFHKLQILQKSVKLSDSTNNEAKASALYFPALFGRDFSRRDFSPINSALNYGYAIIRGCIVRHLIGSGLLPSLGVFHSNQFNPFNLADDLIEPYRPFVDSKVLSLELGDQLELSHRIELANLLNAKVVLGQKAYPLHRSITRAVWSLSRYICNQDNDMTLPIFGKESNGREVYESASDV